MQQNVTRVVVSENDGQEIYTCFCGLYCVCTKCVNRWRQRYENILKTSLCVRLLTCTLQPSRWVHSHRQWCLRECYVMNKRPSHPHRKGGAQRTGSSGREERTERDREIGIFEGEREGWWEEERGVD